MFPPAATPSDEYKAPPKKGARVKSKISKRKEASSAFIEGLSGK